MLCVLLPRCFQQVPNCHCAHNELYALLLLPLQHLLHVKHLSSAMQCPYPDSRDYGMLKRLGHTAVPYENHSRLAAFNDHQLERLGHPKPRPPNAQSERLNSAILVGSHQPCPLCSNCLHGAVHHRGLQPGKPLSSRVRQCHHTAARVVGMIPAPRLACA
jgi:hypothetical protein